MDRTLKAVYIWIVLALVWMGLELLLYGEIQLRTVDDKIGRASCRERV